MTNIPAELMKKAERICKFEGDPKMLLADSVVLIAIALHARDKRAAEIAKRKYEGKDGVTRFVQTMAGHEIADAILTYDAT